MEDALIAAVYKRKPLWNPSNKLYKNVPVMMKLWDEVAQETNTEEKTVRAKWKNLRTYYFRELRRLEKANSDNDGEHASNWQFFKQLKFLTNKEARLERDSVMEIDSVSFEDNDPQEPVRSPYQKIIKIQQAASPSPDASKSSTKKSKIVQRQASILTKSQPVQISRKRARFVSDNIYSDEELEEPEEKPQVTDTEQLKDLNDDLLFFQSLLPYMKQIPLRNKLKLRSKIQNIILEELP